MCRFYFPLVFLAVLLALGGSVFSQDEDAYTLSLSDATGIAGGTVAVAVSLDVEGTGVRAWQFSICHDDESLSIDSVEDGEGLDDIYVWFRGKIETDDGLMYACLLDKFQDPTQDDELAAGDEYEILVVTYALDEDLEEETELSFCTLTAPQNDVIAFYPAIARTGDDYEELTFPDLEDATISTISGIVSTIPLNSS